jgi:hypothetical protein
LRLLLAALVALGGATPPSPGVAVDPSLDDAVIAAALDDLLTYKGKDTPVYGPFSHKKPLAFALMPASRPLTVEGLLYRKSEDLWKMLSAAEVEASREAAESLVERTKTLSPDSGFTISDKRLRLRDAPMEEKENPWGFDRTTRAWRPGYSKEGHLAIVRFNIPWSSFHSADATYVLVRQDGAWKVRVRQFVFYM